MLEKLTSKAEESMERALHHANKTDGNKDREKVIEAFNQLY